MVVVVVRVVVVVAVVLREAVAVRVSTWSMVSASENSCKTGYRLVSVGVSVRMDRELPQTICLVLSKRKLTEVAVYSPLCSRCCRKKAAYSRLLWNVLESRGIGAGSSPIGCEGFMKAALYYFQMLIILSGTHMGKWGLQCTFKRFSGPKQVNSL